MEQHHFSVSSTTNMIFNYKEYWYSCKTVNWWKIISVYSVIQTINKECERDVGVHYGQVNLLDANLKKHRHILVYFIGSSFQQEYLKVQYMDWLRWKFILYACKITFFYPSHFFLFISTTLDSIPASLQSFSIFGLIYLDGPQLLRFFTVRAAVSLRSGTFTLRPVLLYSACLRNVYL